MNGTRHWIAPAALGAAIFALVLAAYAAGRANTPTAAASEPAAACDCLTSTDVLTSVRGLEREVASLRATLARDTTPAAGAASPPQPGPADEPSASVDEVLDTVSKSLDRRGADLRNCLERSGTREEAPKDPVQAMFDLESTGEIIEVRLDPSPLSEAAQRCLLSVLTKEAPVPSTLRLPGRMSIRRELPLSN